MSKPNWINVSRFGSIWEEEIDVNAEPMRYRHRRAKLGDGRLEQHGRTSTVEPWRPGAALDRKLKVKA